MKNQRKIRVDKESAELITLKKDSEMGQKITPIVLDKKQSDLFFFQCSGCGGRHFRHAGYMEMLLPYIRSDQSKHMGNDAEPVKVCCKCRKCFLWVNNQVYDVTDLVDLEAWIELEKDMHKATGPGGNC